MSANPYDRVKGGRLTFKGGSVAATSKSIDKKKKKSKTTKPIRNSDDQNDAVEDVEKTTENAADGGGGGGAGEVYTIDAAKKLKYDELFPVEAKKFGYRKDKTDFKSVEEALDDRAKKKADRYCK